MSNRKRLDLANVVQDASESLRSALPAGVDVRLTADWGVVAVEGDRSALRHLVADLARVACGSRPRPGTLRLRLARDPRPSALEPSPECPPPGGGYHALLITYRPEPVAGRGNGSPAIEVPDPAALDEVVDAHDGRLCLPDSCGGGEVRLYLPAAPERRSPERLRREMLQTPVGSMPTGTETILLVDDDETLRRTGKRILERLGYRVLLAADGEEALEVHASRRGGIDLIVTDVRMPRLGGLDLLQRLREMGAEVKVLIASGSTGADEEQRAETDGVPMIAKPWGLADFAGRVRRVLDGEE
jgi:CheY-like chemotaxis protein